MVQARGPYEHVGYLNNQPVYWDNHKNTLAIETDDFQYLRNMTIEEQEEFLETKLSFSAEGETRDE